MLPGQNVIDELSRILWPHKKLAFSNVTYIKAVMLRSARYDGVNCLTLGVSTICFAAVCFQTKG